MLDTVPKPVPLGAQPDGGSSVSLVQSIACTRETFAEDQFLDLAGAFGRAVLESFLARGRAVIGAAAPSIGEFLSRAGRSEAPAFWSPQIGICRQALSSRNDLSIGIPAFGQVLLDLAFSGVPGTWELAFDVPAILHWRQYRLPEANSIRVESDGEEISLCTSDSNLDLHCRLHSVGSRLAEDPRITQIAHLQRNQHLILLPTGIQVREAGLNEVPCDCLGVIEDRHQSSLHASLDLLQASLRPYYAWITRVARSLCLVNSAPETLNSGSFEGMLGFIYMTGIASRVKTAEMLIHESAHQYFYLLGRLSPFTESDTVQYYSPFVRRQRPVEKLLVAYHAFANVEIFYRDCMNCGVDEEECLQAIAQLRDDLDMVEGSLYKATCLTSTGSELFHTLRTFRHCASGGDRTC